MCIGTKNRRLSRPDAFKRPICKTIRCKINRILKLDYFVNYCFSKTNFLNDSIAYVVERCTIEANIWRAVRDTEMIGGTFGGTNVFFHSPKFDKNRGSRRIHLCLYMSHRISHVSLFAN